MRSLKSMTGEMIIARIPCLDKEDMTMVRLHRVEAHGIWVESQRFTESLLDRFGFTVSTTTPMLFVPFAKIDFIVVSAAMPCFSEPAFGLGDE